MKIEILTQNLTKALSTVERLTKKNLSLPVLQNVLLETDKNFLKISSTDLETSITFRILSKVEKEGKIAVPASLFSTLTGLIKEKKISLEAQNNILFLKTENQQAQIQGIDPEEYPIIPKIEVDEFVELERNNLNEALSQVVNIPNFSQVRPEISGIYFSFKKNVLKIVGTDSFRLGEKTIFFEEKAKKEGDFILPQSSTRELLNILSQEEGNMRIYFSPKQVMFEWLNPETSHSYITLLSRLIEGEYPNYQEIIPNKFTTQITLQKQEFLEEIKKAGLFSGKIAEVRIMPLKNKGRIKISSESSGIGRNESFLKAEITEEEKIESISFNYKFLIDGLNNIRSSEVVFKLSGEDGPGVLAGVGDDTYLYILMPIKST